MIAVGEGGRGGEGAGGDGGADATIPPKSSGGRCAASIG